MTKFQTFSKFEKKNHFMLQNNYFKYYFCPTFLVQIIYNSILKLDHISFFFDWTYLYCLYSATKTGLASKICRIGFWNLNDIFLDSFRIDLRQKKSIFLKSEKQTTALNVLFFFLKLCLRKLSVYFTRYQN